MLARDDGGAWAGIAQLRREKGMAIKKATD
jgi:hypothetical protein